MQSVPSRALEPAWTAPETRRESLVEELHGREIADPYRWLEKSSRDPELAEWVTTQARLAADYLQKLPGQAAFRTRLEELWRLPRKGSPWRCGDHWFQLTNDGAQDQDVLMSSPAVVGAPRWQLPEATDWKVLLDPNEWTADGTAALSGLSITQDGTLAAFARSDRGSDWMTWRVIEVDTGHHLPDEVPWSKFSTAAWLPDNCGFLYSAYEASPASDVHTGLNIRQLLRLHRLGTEGDDEIVYQRPDHPEWGFRPLVSHDGGQLIVTVTHGTDPVTRIHTAPLTRDGIGEIRPLLDLGDAHYEPLGVLDDQLIAITDHQAPMGRVIAITLSTGEIREVIPAGEDRLLDATLLGGSTRGESAWLVVHTLHHASSRLSVHDAGDGLALGQVDLPELGSVTAVRGGRRDSAFHMTVESFTAPPTIFRVEVEQPTRAIEVSPPPFVGSTRLIVEEVLVRHAGVEIPLFLVHDQDVTPTGDIPTVLWGYGGFDIPITPTFKPGWRAWTEAGGLIAVACLRGGGEYGRSWHDDGRLRNKERVFEDALACAAWLAGQRRSEIVGVDLVGERPRTEVWSSPAHLGIEGRSNGGLLVGACLTRAPDAFATAVPEVGVLDMLRFHRFTIGWAWTSDYGSPDDPDAFEVLSRYSPYHQVREGRRYPATLITTAETDDRVVPAHSYKFAAALQNAQAGNAPIVLRIEVSAGHGAGKPVSKLLDERADILAFHAHHLGLKIATSTGIARPSGAER